MANEFIIKNGFRSQGNSEITGSISVLQGGYNILNTSTYSLKDSANASSINWDDRALNDVSGAQSISWRNRTLKDSSTLTSVDWTNRIAYDGLAKSALNWSNRSLYDSSTTESANWTNRILFDTSAKASLRWQARIMYDTSTKASIDWGSREMYDTAESKSIAWAARYLISPTNVIVVDWANGAFTGSLFGTSSYATTAAYASTAAPGGSSTQMQYNNGGTLSGTDGLTYDRDWRSLRLGETVTSGNFSISHGNATQTYGTFSHAQGTQTRAGIGTAFQASYSSSGAYILPAEYGDISAVFTANDTLYFNDTSYSNLFGETQVIVYSSTFDGVNTNIRLVDTNITTSLADIATYDPINNTGDRKAAGESAHAEGESTISFGVYSHAEGSSTFSAGIASHAEGTSTKTIGDYSHAEGESTQTAGYGSHAEGESTISYGDYSHAEGQSSIAGSWGYSPDGEIKDGQFKLSNTYGDVTLEFIPGQFLLIDDMDGAIVINGESPGYPTVYKFEINSVSYNSGGTYQTEITLVDTTINHTGKYSIGLYSTADPIAARSSMGSYSHASGRSTNTRGYASTTTGWATEALGYYQTVVGQGNLPTSNPGAFIVGNGIYDIGSQTWSTRSNLIHAAGTEVQITGSLNVSGSIYGTLANIVKGEATIDFGAAPGSNYATTTISTTNVTNNSNIHIYIMSTASADHNAMEHQIFSLYGTVMPDNIIDNTSFDIVALSQLRLDGTFKVRYTINNN